MSDSRTPHARCTSIISTDKSDWWSGEFTILLNLLWIWFYLTWLCFFLHYFSRQSWLWLLPKRVSIKRFHSNQWESGHWQLLAIIGLCCVLNKNDKKQSCSTQKLSLNFINKLPKNITPDGRNYQKPSSKSEQLRHLKQTCKILVDIQ